MSLWLCAHWPLVWLHCEWINVLKLLPLSSVVHGSSETDLGRIWRTKMQLGSLPVTRGVARLTWTGINEISHRWNKDYEREKHFISGIKFNHSCFVLIFTIFFKTKFKLIIFFLLLLATWGQCNRNCSVFGSSSGLRNRLCLFSTSTFPAWLDSARSLLFSIMTERPPQCAWLITAESPVMSLLAKQMQRNNGGRLGVCESVTMVSVSAISIVAEFQNEQFWFLGTSHSHDSSSDIIDGSVVGLQSVDLTFSDRLGSLVIPAKQVLKKNLVPGTATWSETLTSNTNGPEPIRC